jgi:hypothetical protein
VKQKSKEESETYLVHYVHTCNHPRIRGQLAQWSWLGRTFKDFVGDSCLLEEDTEEKSTQTSTSDKHTRWSVSHEGRKVTSGGSRCMSIGDGVHVYKKVEG